MIRRLLTFARRLRHPGRWIDDRVAAMVTEALADDVTALAEAVGVMGDGQLEPAVIYDTLRAERIAASADARAALYGDSDLDEWSYENGWVQ